MEMENELCKTHAEKITELSVKVETYHQEVITNTNKIFKLLEGQLATKDKFYGKIIITCLGVGTTIVLSVFGLKQFIPSIIEMFNK